MRRTILPMAAAILLSLGEIHAFQLPSGRVVGLRSSHAFQGSRRSLCPAGSASPRVLPSTISRTRAQVAMQAADEEKAAESAPPATPQRYLTAQKAKDLDKALIDGGAPLNVLMEMAGLSVADAFWASYSPTKVGDKKVLCVAGKGNNGGDALVAARYLKHYGYNVEVVYPEPNESEPFIGLVKQLDEMEIVISADLPESREGYFAVIDGIFGFSYEGPPREPWDGILARLKDYDNGFGKCELVSIDVPSGWNVDSGPPEDAAINLYPGLLISLTAPKECSRKYFGRHLLGMRWIPERVVKKFNLAIPTYDAVKTWTTVPPPELSSLSASEPVQAVMRDEPSGGEDVAEAAAAAQAGSDAIDIVAKQGIPDPEIQAAIDKEVQMVLEVLGEQESGWEQALRQRLVTNLVPLGYESVHSPDRTKIAKVIFLAAKTLRNEGAQCLDMLAEGREMAETAFEDGWDMEAGLVLRGIAKLYAAEGEDDASIMVTDEINRIIEERDYPKNLEPRAPRPRYNIKDKWNVVIRGPEGVGEPAIAIVARPVQQAKLLLKAWLGASELPEDTMGDYELRVPEEATSWRVGLIDTDLEIGMAGVMPDGDVEVVLRRPAAPKEDEEA